MSPRTVRVNLARLPLAGLVQQQVHAHERRRVPARTRRRREAHDVVLEAIAGALTLVVVRARRHAPHAPDNLLADADRGLVQLRGQQQRVNVDAPASADEGVPHEETLRQLAGERRLAERIRRADRNDLDGRGHGAPCRLLARVSHSAGSSLPRPQKTTPTLGSSVCGSHAASVQVVDVPSSNHVSWAPPDSSCQS